MIVLLHIQVASISEITYQNPFAELAKATDKELILCDIDTHSEKMVIDHALELLKTADGVVLYFAIKSPQPLGGVQKVLGVLPGKNRTSLRMILSGHHNLLEQLGRKLGDGIFSVIPDEGEARKQILDFVRP